MCDTAQWAGKKAAGPAGQLRKSRLTTNNVSQPSEEESLLGSRGSRVTSTKVPQKSDHPYTLLLYGRYKPLIITILHPATASSSQVPRRPVNALDN